jgi:selenide,water dikinase
MLELLGETIRGGVDIASKAGVFVLGGHSIDDREPKYGMVAVGEVHPDSLITNAGARPGDALILTKPLGTGILSTALKRGAVDDEGMKPAVRSMSALNAGAARAMEQLGEGVHAATDITGFGLLGHLFNVCRASEVSARITASGLPVFDGVRGLIGKDVVPGGTTRNMEAAAEFTEFDPSVEADDRVLVSDAQTSGGLLIAVDPDAEAELIEALKAEGTLAAARIGEITAVGKHCVRVTP